MFRRRVFFSWAIASTLALSACSQLVPKQVNISQAEMVERLQAHFPKRYPVAGLLQMEMQQPALQLLPDSNQLQTVLALQLSGAALPQTYTGHLDVRFGLRYEPSDHTVRAHNVQIQSFKLEGMHAALNRMLDTYSGRLASQALESVALYTVPANELKLLQKLNLQLGTITVTAEGLEVAIAPVPAPLPAPSPATP